ncbi:hypothetical protein SAMN04244574_02708 [Azotobacter beijerinckii]|uniref:Uncharacterized protein n=1 Tax=Azotobacter beijerinckii TaxID=170623 RepID=A0A1I4E194_9GAMM|nr:hypothetical protein SAMN04244571_02878 [Azotobacter beijerinckii]SFK99598.1 hypothetical protein SAMN04244574_02708 [Azotobacter beijerinckii]
MIGTYRFPDSPHARAVLANLGHHCAGLRHAVSRRPAAAPGLDRRRLHQYGLGAGVQGHHADHAFPLDPPCGSGYGAAAGVARLFHPGFRRRLPDRLGLVAVALPARRSRRLCPGGVSRQQRHRRPGPGYQHVRRLRAVPRRGAGRRGDPGLQHARLGSASVLQPACPDRRLEHRQEHPLQPADHRRAGGASVRLLAGRPAGLAAHFRRLFRADDPAVGADLHRRDHFPRRPAREWQPGAQLRSDEDGLVAAAIDLRCLAVRFPRC